MARKRAGEEKFDSYTPAWEAAHLLNQRGAYPGAGATLSLGSDRYPYTVIRAISAGVIVVQEDRSERTDSNGMSDMQEHNFFRNPAGRTHVLKYINGRWVGSYGSRLWSVGRRSAHYDFSR